MLSVKFNSTESFTATELIKLQKAAKILEAVVNSEEFKAKVLAFSFTNTDGISNEEIYNLIMSGKEVLSPEEDYEIDVDVTIYYAFNSVIGYTYPNTLRTWINRRYFKKFTAVGIASNMSHEWLHKIGFNHSFYRTKERPFSVPYAIGYMVEELGTKY